MRLVKQVLICVCIGTLVNLLVAWTAGLLSTEDDLLYRASSAPSVMSRFPGTSPGNGTWIEYYWGSAFGVTRYIAGGGDDRLERVVIDDLGFPFRAFTCQRDWVAADPDAGIAKSAVTHGGFSISADDSRLSLGFGPRPLGFVANLLTYAVLAFGAMHSVRAFQALRIVRRLQSGECIQCGHAIAPGAAICTECGHRAPPRAA